LGRLDREVSVLGLGTARLPRHDEAAGIEIVRRAIDGGVNYLDLGLPYDAAAQEPVARLVGRALRGGDRPGVMVAAGLPMQLIGSAEDIDHYLDRLLGLLGTDRIDFFLVGGLDRYAWPRLQSLEILPHLEAAAAEGRIGRTGFAFHDIFQHLKEIIEAYDKWSLVRLQYSYMDIDHHPGTVGIGYAAQSGLGVVVAEPLKGGRLTRQPPAPVAKVWAGAPRDWTPAAWGLRWAWNHPGVSTVVTDVSTMAELEEDLALAEPGSITVGEEIFLGRVRDAYRKLRPVPCTACRGCMPCPQGIDAPRIFELYNDAVMYGDIETMRTIFANERHRIGDCDECGACAAACGLRIDIPGFLKKAQALLK
jgi:predicted aldo/keto reductase-like oxidoreductase